MLYRAKIENSYSDGYIFSPPPFYDIIVINRRSKDVEILDFFKKDDRWDIRFVSPKLALITNNKGFADSILSGYCFGNNKLLHGVNEENFKFEDMLYKTGNYTYWLLDVKKIKICHDFFGLGLISYFKNDDYTIVSNRIQLLAICIALYKCEYKLNLPFIQLLALFSYPFNQHPINNDYYIKEIKRLSLSQYIEVSDEDFEIIDRNNNDIVLEDEYKTLLNKGVREISNNVELIYGFYKKEKICVDLSGGKDTRMLLSAIMNNEALRDKIQIKTYDIKGRKDLDIALLISEVLNLKFVNESGGNWAYLSQEMAIQLYRSFFMGMYYRMPPSFSATPYSIDNIQQNVTLSGGMGEIYRDYYYNFFKDNDKITFGDALLFIVRGSEWYNNYSDTEKYEIELYIKESLNGMYDKPVNVGRMKFYDEIRARLHFGLRLFNFFYSEAVYYPLMSYTLHKAMLIMDKNEQTNAKLCYDFIENCFPVLNAFCYDSEWKFADSQRKYEIVFTDIGKKEMKSQYKQKMEEYADSKRKNVVNTISSSVESEISYIIEQTEKAFANIYIKHPELKSTLYKLENIFYRYVNMNDRDNIRGMAAKIFGLEDCLYPLISMRNGLSDSELILFKMPIKDINIVTDLNQMIIDVKLHEWVDTKIYKYSIYLYSKHKIVNRILYQQSTRFVLSYCEGEIDSISSFAEMKTEGRLFTLTKNLR